MASNQKKSSAELVICTLTDCIDDKDQDCLVCLKCRRLVHFRCTQLPPYQIQLFLDKHKSTHYKYVCPNCVTVTPKVLELVPAKPRTLPSSVKRENETLRRELNACKGLLKQNEIDRKKINEQQHELESLKSKLSTDPGLHTFEFVEQKLETKIESKIESLKEMLEETIKKECKFLSQTYANVTGSKESPDSKALKEVIRDAIREEETEEYSKQKRASNVIVHGVVEQSINDDKTWASNLIKDTHSRSLIKRVARLGKEEEGKKRPLLVSLNDESDKWNLLGNLTALKDNATYKGISVTEDLTPDERKQFKVLSTEAKTRNSQEKSETYIYRVRGNSKNGFYLKKIKVANHQ